MGGPEAQSDRQAAWSHIPSPHVAKPDGLKPGEHENAHVDPEVKELLQAPSSLEFAMDGLVEQLAPQIGLPTQVPLLQMKEPAGVNPAWHWNEHEEPLRLTSPQDKLPVVMRWTGLGCPEHGAPHVAFAFQTPAWQEASPDGE